MMSFEEIIGDCCFCVYRQQDDCKCSHCPADNTEN